MSGSFRTNQFLILMFKIAISILAITLSLSLSAAEPNLDQSVLEDSTMELGIDSSVE